MERTKENEVVQVVDPDAPIRWKKTGLGSFLFNGRHIKPGQVFSARPSQISKSFRDLIVPLDTLPEKLAKIELPIPGKKAEYTVTKRETSPWYDVIDSNGKAINTKGLKQEVAEQLKKDLER